MSHTDKNWIVDPFDASEVVDITDEKNHILIIRCGTGHDVKDVIANAQLIAAAPDMLRLLHKLRDYLKFHINETGISYLEIESAINKAEGRI